MSLINLRKFLFTTLLVPSNNVVHISSKVETKKISFSNAKPKFDNDNEINVVSKEPCSGSSVKIFLTKVNGCVLDIDESFPYKKINFVFDNSHVVFNPISLKKQLHFLSKNSSISSKSIKVSSFSIKETQGKNNFSFNKLESESFEFVLKKNDKIKCSIEKITSNSLLDFESLANTKVKFNPVALYTLINVYDIKRKKFINLPLGVLGGDIGSTSFPTVVLNNRDSKTVDISQMKSQTSIKKNILFSSFFLIFTFFTCSFKHNSYLRFKIYKKYFNNTLKSKLKKNNI